ncbi:Crp/Fnr family transcriptional regulator [Mycobacterium hackensackense]|uniref:Crp/Fnr family transcriptional regulator n=1 Tax=Mycobacterium hackensackense TaxID=228909 RepID=UPI0022658A55|nr:Crp/Fnr family transcriptional regulator [Mycobacterium hackensackense]MCV7252246.1 Crp/Fnr family transcriptional regulator [Mycobacterium hackensackense]
MDSVVRRAAIFHGVGTEAVDALAGQLMPIDFDPGTVIFAKGDSGDRLYIIASGKVKISDATTSDRESILAVMGPSDMFGELALFDPGPRTSTATAITDVLTVSMDRAVLRSWISGRPEISEQLLRVLARRLRRTNDAIMDQIFTDVAGRVAKQLLHLARQFGTQQGSVLRVHHGLRQTELAQLVGASRETVNKTLADFAVRGWILLDSSGLTILDTQRLVARAAK